MEQYKKKLYQIRAQKVPAGIAIHNYLENSDYVTSDAKCIILTGTVGEHWTVTLEKLSRTYTYLDGSPITAANIPKGQFAIETIVDKNADTIFAEKVTEVVQVSTSWGEVLTASREGVPHGAGDYIVSANKNGEPNPNDRWVVNGLVFENTYEEVV